ncbi:hypothetical protein Hdeb2414_s0025g00661641 [Helianthus debilis subsp. tardiflorus]
MCFVQLFAVHLDYWVVSFFFFERQLGCKLFLGFDTYVRLLRVQARLKLSTAKTPSQQQQNHQHLLCHQETLNTLLQTCRWFGYWSFSTVFASALTMLPSPPTAGFCAQYRTTPKLRVLWNRPASPKFNEDSGDDDGFAFFIENLLHVCSLAQFVISSFAIVNFLFVLIFGF